MKKIFILVSVLLTFLISSVAMAAGHLIDGARLLTPAEAQKVEAALTDVSNKYGVNVMVHTSRSLGNEQQVRAYARSVVDQKYANQKAVIFALHYSNVKGQSHYYMASNKNMADFAIKAYAIDKVKATMLPSMKDRKFGKAFTDYAAGVEKFCEYGKVNGHPQTEDEGLNVIALLIALVLGAGVAYVVRGSLIDSMTNVHPAIEASEYLDKSSINISEAKDQYLYTHTTVVPKSKGRSGGGASDNDGGSGGSGGGGSF